MELFHGTVQPDLEVRSSGNGRTIFGIAVPWDQAQEIHPTLTEQFRSGVFNHQLNAPNRVWFSREHIKMGGHLIGVPFLMRNDAKGLYFEAKASNTPLGNETYELAKDGALRQVSIMFQPRQDRRLGRGVVERVTANLKEIAMVLEGAYGDLAAAAGVRSAVGEPDAQPYGELITPNLDEAKALLAGLPRL